MTYSAGNQILASDYNTFQTNLNAIWSTGSGDSGWGQTNIGAVSTGGIVTATNWATLVNNLAVAGAQTDTTITSRTAPVTGNIVAILANVATDITNCTTNRGNATSSGTEYGTFTGTTSKTAATGSGQSAWTITFAHTVTFPSAAAARYFWNAGGRIRLQYGKTSTGTDIDPDWNTLAGQCGSIYLTGRVNGAAQTIAGVSYTGTTRIGGTGGTQTTLATTTGWYQLTGSPTTIFQLNNDISPYTGEYIQTTATATSSTVLDLLTVWNQPAVVGAGTTCNISGGTATTSPSVTITGTAPTTLCTYFPPSTAQGLSASWGTPTITSALVAPTRTSFNVAINANTQNYTAGTSTVVGYVAGYSDVTYTINSGIVVGSANTTASGFTVDTSWAAGDTVTIVNTGYIVGAGGVGGRAGGGFTFNGGVGLVGGPALTVQRATTINNNTGTVGGGGGGGGGGSSNSVGVATGRAGAGGGGAGDIVGTGGEGGGSGNGSPGTLTTGGAGVGPQTDGGAGGAGGSLGVAGTGGSPGSAGSPGAGGAAGFCTTTGSSAFITWSATGTRLGTLG
jgi:hypothetical protein